MKLLGQCGDLKVSRNLGFYKDSMFSAKIVRKMDRYCQITTRCSFFLELDLIPAFITFFCCLFWALEFGILVGVGIQVFFILYNSARPSIVIETQQVLLSRKMEIN